MHIIIALAALTPLADGACKFPLQILVFAGIIENGVGQQRTGKVEEPYPGLQARCVLHPTAFFSGLFEAVVPHAAKVRASGTLM